MMNKDIHYLNVLDHQQWAHYKKDFQALIFQQPYAPEARSLENHFIQKDDVSQGILLSLIQEELVGGIVYRMVFENADIDYIIVKDSFRKKKLGRQLFEEFISVCKKSNVSEVHLEVGVKNTPALSFYLKQGFQKQIIRKNYYSHIEDAQTLSLRI